MKLTLYYEDPNTITDLILLACEELDIKDRDCEQKLALLQELNHQTQLKIIKQDKSQ